MTGPLNISALCRVWLHSKEEDLGAVLVYRPMSYKFPPSRGRSGFEFQRNGLFKSIGIGGTDISSVHEGKWVVVDESAGKIRITFEGESRLLKVVSVTNEKLVVQEEQSG